MNLEKYLKEKQFFIFEFDNVIYPEKDYMLQVYYLFAQFIAYGEQISETDVLKYMKETYLEEGDKGIFAKTATKFNIPDKYKVNFDLLLQNARLPLKLLIYNDVLAFLQAIVVERKQIFLLVRKNPAMQLNKIKQTEWNGLEQYLTVIFTEEFESEINALRLVMDQHQMDESKTLLIGSSLFAVNSATMEQVDYLKVDELFVV